MRRALAPLLSLALAACGGSSAPAPADAGGSGPRGTLVVASQSDIGNLNPITYETAFDANILSNVIMPLFDSTLDCALTLTPALATSWSFDEAGTTLTVSLRDDLTWSDGVKVTAHDVAYTYELVRNPAVASPRLGFVQHFTPDSPRVIDDHTVAFSFTKAYDRTTMMSHANLGPLPKHAFEGADPGALRGHPVSMKPLASGPWILTTHERGSRWIVEPNTAYSGDAALKPSLRRVVFRVIPEYATRLTELRNGGVDLMEGINIEDVDDLRANHPDIRIASRGYRTSDYIGWNSTNPLFADKEVRKALTLAIDIDAMIGKLLTGKDGTRYAKKATGTVTPELCKAYDDSLAALPHDPDQARAILAAKGWADTNGDGILDKDGTPFRFTLATNAGNKRRADASILVQADLRKVGIDVQLSVLESNSFFETLRKREYEAALAGWAAALFVDPSAIWGADQPGKRNEFNFTAYNNPAAQALIDRGLAEPDPDKALPIWKELQQVIYEDQPYTFLWWREELAGIHNRFENTEITPQNLLDDLHAWSVPADKVKYAR